MMVGASASGGPPIGYRSVGYEVGGGGCRVRKAGTMIKKRQHASGRTGSRYGSMQTNVYMNRKDMV